MGCSSGVSPALPTLSVSQGGVPAIEGRHTPSGYALAGKYVGVSDGVVHYAKRSVYTTPTLSITAQGGVPATEGRYSPYGYARSGQYVAVNPGAVHYAKRSANRVEQHDTPYGYAYSGWYVAQNAGAVHTAKRSVYTPPTLSITAQGGVPATEGQYTPYGYARSGQCVAVNPGAVHYAKRSTWTGQCFNNFGKAVECDPVQPTGYAGLPQAGVPEAVVPWTGQCVNYLGETVECRNF